MCVNIKKLRHLQQLSPWFPFTLQWPAMKHPHSLTHRQTDTRTHNHSHQTFAAIICSTGDIEVEMGNAYPGHLACKRFWEERKLKYSCKRTKKLSSPQRVQKRPTQPHRHLWHFMLPKRAWGKSEEFCLAERGKAALAQMAAACSLRSVYLTNRKSKIIKPQTMTKIHFDIQNEEINYKKWLNVDFLMTYGWVSACVHFFVHWRKTNLSALETQKPPSAELLVYWQFLGDRLILIG